MKYYLFFPLMLVLLTLTGCSSNSLTKNSPKVTLILDTDCGPDYDDVGTLATMFALEAQKEVKVLAVMSSNKNKHVIPCLDVICRYYNHGDMLLGEVKGEGADRETWHKNKWTEFIPKKYNAQRQSGEEIPDAVQLYRELLSKQADHSVTICTVGFLTNISRLLDSKGDKFSPLNGMELVKAKVKNLVCMAGQFPEGKEFNIYCDFQNAKKVFQEWPGEILFSGFEIGVNIYTGKNLIDLPYEDSPIIDAYRMCLAEDNPRGRESWDQTTILAAVRGTSDYYDVRPGEITINEDGSNGWIDKAEGKHKYLVCKISNEKLTQVIEELMMYIPKK